MTAFMMERIAQTLAANQKLRLHMQGNEFRVIASTWPLSVSFFKGGAIVGSASGVLAGDYSRGMEFDGVEIANGATAQSVVVGLSNGSAGSDRITGSVEVIDGGKSRVVTGKSFMDALVLPADATKYTLVAWTNPAASGQNVFINQLMFAVENPTAGMVGLSKWDPLLTTDATAAASFSKANGDAFTGVHKVSWEHNLAALGGAWGGRYYLTPTSPPVMIRLTEPICLTPGNGLIIKTMSVNMSLMVALEGYEEAAA